MNMNITDRAAIVLQQIDAALAGIAVTHEAREQEFGDALIEIRGNGRTLNTEEMTRARIFYNAGALASRTLMPDVLRGLKTAIEVFTAMVEIEGESAAGIVASRTLTALCDQLEAGR
jgi:hypothetical protein